MKVFRRSYEAPGYLYDQATEDLTLTLMGRRKELVAGQYRRCSSEKILVQAVTGRRHRPSLIVWGKQLFIKTVKSDVSLFLGCCDDER